MEKKKLVLKERKYWCKSNYPFFYFNKKEMIFFWTDCLLCFYIFFGLFFSGFRKETAQVQKNKKDFFFFFLMSLFFLTLHFFFSCFFCFNLFSPFSQIFSSNYFEIGVLFFRIDFLTNFFILILNFIFLCYLILFLNVFTTTQKHLKYINEIPILLVTIFLSLKYFLLSSDFLLIILALELATLCTIILLSLQLTTLNNLFPLEATLKYFLFNGVAISFMLLGISGFFLFSQSFNFEDLNLSLLLTPYFIFLHFDILLIFQVIFFFGFLIKLGCVPLHFWLPDVYEGIEFLMTIFLILIISPILTFKLFIFVKVLLNHFELFSFLYSLFLCLGFFSIVVGIFSGISQTKIKRFLAYASLNHFGFILISLGIPTYLGFFASFFYLLIYFFTNLTFFFFIILIQKYNYSTYIYFNQLKQIMNTNYLYFFFLLIPFFSYAGFPPLAGFFSKFFVLAALVDFQHYMLCFFILIYIIFNAFLYLRFIKIAIFEKQNYTFLLPVHFNIYEIKTKYTLQKTKIFSGSKKQKYFLFFLFLCNFMLSFFLIFFSTFSLFCSQFIFYLFLFY
jgi:proton-translocating NADH-quinone oxidoreductase chain N